MTDDASIPLICNLATYDSNLSGSYTTDVK